MSEYRHEYKYIINAREDAILSSVAAGLMDRDSHTDESGKYIIRSLYFDDINDRCFYENEAGLNHRWKYRIRYYGRDLSYISLEKKIKDNGMTKKVACRLSQTEVEDIISGEIYKHIEKIEKYDNTKSYMLSEMFTNGMIPKVIVTYEREPFVYPAGNVRVTFDRCISSSLEIDRFLYGDYSARPVMANQDIILEVKWDEIIPTFIKQSLTIGNLRWSTFSKYYMSRIYHM